MARTQQALGFNTDPTSIVSHEYDVESGNCFKRHVITAVVNGTEHNIDPSDANNWHTPKNEREYLRSPQRAEWRTAKEKKMDQYLESYEFISLFRARASTLSESCGLALGIQDQI